MPGNIFDDDERLLDYGAIDELSAMGIGDRGYSNVMPPYGSDDLFDDQFERRARELQSKPAGTQPVQIVHPKTGPWSGNNQLGIQVDFIPSAASRDTEQTLLKLDEWGFPEVWSLMLGMTYSDEAWGSSISAAFNVVAKIRAGVGGVTQEMEVDWMQGTTLSLCMNALNVIGDFTASVSTPTDLRLQLSLSKGKVNGRPPQRSFQIPAVLAGNSSARFRIPAFARSVMAVDRGSANSFFTAGNGRMEFFASPNSGGTVGNVNGEQLLSFGSNGFPIPTFARYFEIEALANSLSVTVIFFLSF